MTEDLQVGIGDALSTDYFFLRDQHTDTQRDYLARARRFVDDEVLPTINDYWDRAEFPWPLVESSARPAWSATPPRPAPVIKTLRRPRSAGGSSPATPCSCGDSSAERESV